MINAKRTLILLFVIYQASFQVQAQEIKIGEKIPDVFLPEVLGYKKNKINLLSEFKGMPLIIDFWFTHCAPCVAFIPRLDSLHQSHKDKFNVLLSNYESREVIEKFIRNKKLLQHLRLPTTTSDTILKKIFPHMTAPHEVWVNRNGIVVAITSHSEITESNILKLINGEKLNLPVKIETKELFTGAKPLIETNKEQAYLYSYIGSYRKGMRNQLLTNADSEFVALKISNLPLKDLYQTAYALEGMKPSQIIYENIDSSIFKYDDATGKNLFCYDLLLKDSLLTTARQYMKQDLDRYFKMSSELRNEPATCYVISKITEHTKNDISSAVDFADSYVENENYVFKNASWDGILSYLNRFSPYPLIDETGYSVKTSINTLISPLNWNNPDQVNQKLKNYNLKVTRTYRNVNLLIFKNHIKNDLTKY
jgi:thiol-disulfide isomerase/thioredoxin